MTKKSHTLIAVGTEGDTRFGNPVALAAQGWRVFLLDPIAPPMVPWRRENPHPKCADCGGDDDGSIRPNRAGTLLHGGCYEQRKPRRREV